MLTSSNKEEAPATSPATNIGFKFCSETQLREMDFNGIKLWDHQIRAISLAQQMRGQVFDHDMGTGKTRSAVAFCRSIVKPENLSIVVTCPLSMVPAWAAEFSYARYEIRTIWGNATKHVKKLVDWQDKPGVLILNHHSLHHPKVVNFLLKRKIHVLIVDESHRFKNPDSSWSKNLQTISDRSGYRILLTGTFAPNDEFDIYQQIRIVNPTVFPYGPFVFRKRFWEKRVVEKKSGGSFPVYRLKPDAKERIKSAIAPLVHTVKKSEVLELPPLITTQRVCELGAAARAQYSKLEEELIAEIKGEKFSVSSALAKVGYLQQMLAIEFKEKFDLLSEVLDEINTKEHKVIIWSHYIASLDAIRDLVAKRKLGYCEIRGGQKPINRQIAIEKFQGDNDTRICIANPQAGGVGIDLTAASYMIYFARGYNFENYAQSQARNYRKGSERHEKITEVILLAQNTIDQTIDNALNKKADTAEFFRNVENRVYE